MHHRQNRLYFATACVALSLSAPLAAQNGAIGGVDPYVKDVVEMVSWGVAIVAASVTGLRAVSEMKHNREQRDRATAAAVEDRLQRERELRWRQAQAGNELVQRMLDDPLAAAAMQILDWSGRSYDVAGYATFKVSENDLPAALRPTRGEFTPKQIFIRDAFDALFFHIARMHRALAAKLVEIGDISMPTSYYVAEMAKRRQIIEGFLLAFHPIAHGLIVLFHEWSVTGVNTTATEIQREKNVSRVI
jgi:hypothetical protein